MTAYYNDHDPGAAAWLRELIRQGHIAPGQVDERSILDVQPSDLDGFTQCHFFAGIGGWSLALRLAGWNDDQPVWTGSPPCQPFSVAGRGLAEGDARHLSPKFAQLVRARRPPLLFGEQVASAAVFGPAAKGNRPGFEGTPPWAWLDDLSNRLEAAHYAVGSSDFPSAGVGAPHIRQRTFFGAVRLADTAATGLSQWRGEPHRPPGPLKQPERLCAVERLEHAKGDGRIERRAEPSWRGAADGCGTRGLADTKHSKRGQVDQHRKDGCNGQNSGRKETHGVAGTRGQVCRLADSHEPRLEGRCGMPERAAERPAGTSSVADSTGPTKGVWRNADWLLCRDGKWRATEPGIFPLADGVSGRVGLLRGAGNAINPQAAKEFILAFTEALDCTCKSA